MTQKQSKKHVFINMKQNFTLLFIFFLGSINAQNLVLNPSFEEYNQCPFIIGYFNGNVHYWSTPNAGSTDYYTICKTERGLDNIKNYNGVQIARTGNGYAGIYVYADENYREYIQGRLDKKLIQGEKYNVTFYVSLAENSTHSISGLNVLFTEEKVNKCHHSNWCEKYITPKKVINKSYSLLENDKKEFYGETKSWTKISYVYTAQGFENYFSFGNFRSNSKTKKNKLVKKAPQNFSYYYIDDVSIENVKFKPTKQKQIEVFKIDEKVEEEILIKPETTYAFKNVLFDFNKATLLSNSIEELDKLSLHLKENKNLNIQIYGHTDNVGLTKRNDELSLLRAKSVSEYLILKGLKKERIQWFGFGSSKSLVENSSEENRAKNRRVEFKLLK